MRPMAFRMSETLFAGSSEGTDRVPVDRGSQLGISRRFRDHIDIAVKYAGEHAGDTEQLPNLIGILLKSNGDIDV